MATRSSPRSKPVKGSRKSTGPSHEDSIPVNDSSSRSTWTVISLQSKLRSLGLSTSGTKATLISRLAQHEREKENVQLTLTSHPLTTVTYFARACVAFSVKCAGQMMKHRNYVLFIASISIIYIALFALENPYQMVVAESTQELVWLGYWLVLGIASSIGLGSGLHTFLLFLGPFIAKVTIHAYDCSSLDFFTHGISSFECRQSNSPLSFFAIYTKVAVETFAWGVGTAVGELPPYFVARAAALAGRSEEELDNLEIIRKKPTNERSLWERIQLNMYIFMGKFGFFGILAAASIPNPLFDLAGITCGHFMVPFRTFFSATFIGKAIFKATFQAFLVVLLFSKGSMDYVLKHTKYYSPEAHFWLNKVIHQQHKRFTEGTETENVSYISILWNGIFFVMIAYFMVSIVNSVATSQLKDESEKKKK